MLSYWKWHWNKCLDPTIEKGRKWKTIFNINYKTEIALWVGVRRELFPAINNFPKYKNIPKKFFVRLINYDD